MAVARSQVRSAGAKALGRLCAGLGEANFPKLVPWLLSSLSSDASSSVEHAGAAEGLAEVLLALGDAKVEELMPHILEQCAEGSKAAREGFSMLWTHIPAVLGSRFERFLAEALPAVLNGLADDAGPVRDACFRGANAMIAEYLEAAEREKEPVIG